MHSMGIFFVSLICFCFLNTSSDGSNALRFTRQATNCRPGERKCKSGECLPKTKFCDGKYDCKDESDETNECLETKDECPSYTYKCAYGACVDANAECDNVIDCVDRSDENTPNCRKNCSPATEFQCTNGNCISRFNVCDGKKDCTDGSDETEKLCSLYRDSCITYVCAYGACVDGDAECNGKIDCADGSDENPTKCGTISTTQSSTTANKNSCQIPRPIENGRYFVPQVTTSLQPGDSLQLYTALKFECNNGYGLYPNDTLSFCDTSGWNPNPPQCLKQCPPRISASTKIDCEFKNNKVSCTERTLEGTLATMKCKNHYKQEDPTQQTTIKCKDGTWDYGLLRCAPVCGKVTQKGTPNVVGGTSTKLGDFPWHVGIYANETNHICGGSLISTNAILSVAHCFSDSRGNKYPIEWYTIAAGIYYRNRFNKKDIYAQASKPKLILIPSDYQGIISNYADDIALVILERPFIITHVVQPVCVDWNDLYDEDQLKTGNTGNVVGWGFTTEEGDPSNELKKLTVPIVDKNVCRQEVPDDFKGFLTSDKICAGYRNGSAVCQGDSGGGLVFYNSDRQEYYIRGLVSVGPPKKTSCDATQYGAYTLVSKHISFIRKSEANNRAQ